MRDYDYVYVDVGVMGHRSTGYAEKSQERIVIITTIIVMILVIVIVVISIISRMHTSKGIGRQGVAPKDRSS